MSKVVCIGESIVDIIPKDSRFVLTAGGAPVNVCACVSALGGEAYFLGNISNDAYGVFLFDQIKKCGIHTTYTKRDSNHKSAISFVSLKDGDRSFEFFRENTADMFLSEDDVADDIFERGDVLHFCSVCLVDSPTKRAHKKAIALAKKNDAIVSFDLNMRPSLWTNDEDMMRAIIEFLPSADIIKISNEELYSLSQYLNSNGEKQAEKKSIQQVFDLATSCKLLVLTKGGNGAIAYDRNLNCVSCSAVQTKVVDTTGAGDCFIGSLLYLISTNKFNLNIGKNTQNQTEFDNKEHEFRPLGTPEHDINGLDKTQFDNSTQNDTYFNQLQTALRFASSACAIEISHHGGLRSMRHLKGLTFKE